MFNSNLHKRRSIRLKGYDYSRAGLYFITICVQNRLCLFGNIENNIMILNDAGTMIEKWYYELENKYPDKRCHEMVVMPNHFHCIIENAPTPDTHITTDMDTNVDAQTDAHDAQTDAHVGTPLRGRPENDVRPENTVRPQYGPTNQKYHATIGDAMDWFKTMTTNEYIRNVKINHWQRFDKKLWQRNYWEHIIRNEQSYNRISAYIQNNPQNWGNDKFFDK